MIGMRKSELLSAIFDCSQHVNICCNGSFNYNKVVFNENVCVFKTLHPFKACQDHSVFAFMERDKNVHCLSMRVTDLLSLLLDLQSDFWLRILYHL